METRPPIDYDRYRAIAARERSLAIQHAIDALLAWVTRRGHAADADNRSASGTPSTRRPADSIHAAPVASRLG